MCIASNAGFSDAGLMTEALKRVGAEKYFRHFFTSKDLGYEKPDERFFTAITDKINVDSEYCVMIGDSYQKDISGAKTVGMKTVLFNEKKIISDFSCADVVIISMQELPDAINQISIPDSKS